IYPFHLGVTEAGNLFSSSIKSAMALGGLLMEGIGDTMRVSITGELENEIKVARAILRHSGRLKEGINLISCPTCGRIEANLVDMASKVEKRLSHIKTPLDISVMGCVVNALGEAKHADMAIAFGNRSGLIIKEGKVIHKLAEKDLFETFVIEVENLAKEREKSLKD
ncbi:flavodoxin-dependent (E)-4-hydroxy-3-methylbut-2-enyl-diphosphate synthase, partial [Helicobacter pylori]